MPLETARAVMGVRPDEVRRSRASRPGPILFVVAGNDGLVLNELTRELYDLAGPPKKWVVVPGLSTHEMYLPQNVAKAMAESVAWYLLHLPPR